MATSYFAMDKYINSTGVILSFDIDLDNTFRFVIENAGASNEIVISARIFGAADYVEIRTITGSDKVRLDIDSYDQIKVECTVYDSLSSHVRVIAKGFGGAI